MNKLVIGCDVGIANTAFACVKFGDSKISIIDTKLVKTEPNLSTGERLCLIKNAFSWFIKDNYKADFVAIENVFFAKNKTSAMQTAKVIGVLELTAYENTKEVSIISPASVKTAVGMKPNTNKDGMFFAVATAVEDIGNTTNNHEVDAIAVAIAGHSKE